ncbi:MAG: MATE family efflux transporter [Thermoguttaceae bacterium]|nr:MATE family efflux transporter [Thermoguttaceae bacterium]
MEIRDKNSVDMTTGALLPKLLMTALPLMASSVLQLLFNAADVVVVGRYASEHSLAAVGATGALVNLITNLFVGLSIGANTLASFYYGARDDEKLRKTVHNSMLLSVFGGAILTVVGIVFAKTFLVWMQTPPEALDLATLYIQVYFSGIIPIMIFNFGSSLLRAKGDTKRPLYYLTFAGLVNVALNLLFVIAFDMDVEGVALATIASQALAAALIVRCMSVETDAFRLQWSLLRVDRTVIARILREGIPAGVQGVVFALSNVVIQSAINGFGPIVMAGSAAAQNVEGFVWVSMYAFSQVAMTFAGQNVGARRYDRLNRLTVDTLGCALVTGLILGNFCSVFAPWLVQIYDERPEVIVSGVTRFRLVCRYYCICGMMDAMVGVIRGLGVSITPTVVSLLGACGLRLVWIFTIFQLTEFHTEYFLFLSYPVSWLVTLTAHVVCYVFILRRLFSGRSERL